jgi:hypothetical protein
VRNTYGANLARSRDLNRGAYLIATWAVGIVLILREDCRELFCL